jgi:hypothetical protein
MRSHLPSIRNSRSFFCSCGLSKVSYPHWPPSCYEEAVDQLHCLIGQSYPHRLYLAQCWLVSLQKKLYESAGKTEHEESPQDLGIIISLMQETCPTLASSPEQPEQNVDSFSINRFKTTRDIRIDCQSLCYRVLREGGSYCLCCCSSHREECPIHRCF